MPRGKNASVKIDWLSEVSQQSAFRYLMVMRCLAPLGSNSQDKPLRMHAGFHSCLPARPVYSASGSAFCLSPGACVHNRLQEGKRCIGRQRLQRIGGL